MTLAVTGGRFLGLDTLRGLAAFGVMLGHYEHFALDATPFRDVLLFFYDHSGRLVEFFICLSGFIFFCKYRKRVSSHAIDLRTFMILRLTRLYPLHFATLIIIAVLQIIYFSINKKYFLYEYNDLYHFILNLFFLNSGFLSAGWSFNGPSWSVSIEIFMYFVFFFVFAFRLRSLFAPLCLVVLGIFLIKHHDVLMFPTIADTVGMGLSCFFIGGLCHMFYEQTLRLNSRQQRLAGNAIAASFFFVFTLVLLATYGAEWAGNAIGDVRLVYILAVFPLAVLTGVTENAFRKVLDNRVTAHLGDISYSMYLVHIPIQVGIMCLATSVISINFTNGSTIILYVLICVAAAEVFYFFYEKPAKERLRKLLLGSSFGAPLPEGKLATE